MEIVREKTRSTDRNNQQTEADATPRTEETRDGAGASGGGNDAGAAREETQERVQTPTVLFQTVTAPKKRGSKTSKKEQAALEATQITPVLIELIQTIAVSAVGPHAAFLPHERMMLEASLTRTLSRVPAGAAERFAGFVDPAMLIGVSFVWFARVQKQTVALRAEAAKETVEKRAEASGGLVPGNVPTKPGTDPNGTATASGIPPQLHNLGRGV